MNNIGLKLASLFACAITALGSDSSEPTRDFGGELDVRALISHVRRAHPAVRFGQAHVAAAESKISFAKTGYIPTLELNAVYTTGFPAGIISLSGIPGAAFRSGPAAGVVLKQNLWDFNRTGSAIDAAEAEVAFRRSESEVQMLQTQEGLLRLYFDCARLRDQVDTWDALAKEFSVIHAQVHTFVQSGQRSKVEEALARAQYEDALTKSQDFGLRYASARKRLIESADLTPGATCPALGPNTKLEIAFDATTEKTPLLESVREDVKLAEAQRNQAGAQYNPRLFGLASYGVMENRSAGSELYSVGIGLTIPLFTGLRKDREVAQAQAQVDLKSARLSMAERQLREAVSRQAESVRSAELRKKRLREELDLLKAAFTVAKQRYFLLKGQLGDLRETVRNLANMHSQLTDARSEEHFARAVYANLLGQLR